MKITKFFTSPRVKSLDEKARTAEYIISTDCKDRYGEIVEQEWDTSNYEKNPIVLFGHDPSVADNVIGKCLAIKTEDGDGKTNTKQTVAKVQFAEEGTSKTSDTVWSLVKQGILRTVSVGFIPHGQKAVEDEDGNGQTTVLTNNELLEFSLVPIPANPQAVALAYEDGSINEKDAKFMLKAYQSEAKFLENSLCDTIKNKNASNKESNAMSDEDINKLAEALGAVIDEKISPKLEEILDKVDADDTDDSDKPADEPTDGDTLDKKPEDDEDKPEDDKPEDGDDEDDEDDPDKKKSEGEDEEAEKQLLKAIEDMTPEQAQELVKEFNL